ncbi:uncharacterized protein LOC115794735 [Archocentrus centrarchus]|uniref:uncharacterized protein LOC115794735 n=1 Tax=Archocentrus centrarchus TaxID=63155 RepID=UPI0011E9ED38|nr:uncharacterized protein LOC115794735 [Archocentrus centrarchus]
MSTARKELVWSIKKNLYRLSGGEAYQLARDIATDYPGDELEPTDEEGCVECIIKYMQSDALLQSEDEGMSQLLVLNDMLCSIIENRDLLNIVHKVAQSQDNVNVPAKTVECTTLTHAASHQSPPVTDALQHTDFGAQTPNTNQSLTQARITRGELGKQPQQFGTWSNPQPSEVHSTHDTASRATLCHTPSHVASERMVSIKDLSYLQRREFKVHGGQIGDHNSDITYSSMCKQIDEGIREGFTDAEVIRGVLRIVKPGVFKDMLINKEEITISEIKSFLRSHLGEKASTELFQELMCAKQNDQETPQQFLYRMIGLKQKILFQSKQASTDIRYDRRTIQGVFLHSIYQGLCAKHTDIRQQLRPLLSNSEVADEEILSQVTKMMSDENEHQRRLGHAPRQKTTHAHSIQVEEREGTVDQGGSEMIQQLSVQVEALANMVATLMDQQTATHSKAVPTQTADQDKLHTTQPLAHQAPTPPPSQPSVVRRGKIFSCTNCMQQGSENCNHCFLCGDPGHRAVGCLKRPKQSGNGSRSLLRDRQRPFHSLSPAQ